MSKRKATRRKHRMARVRDSRIHTGRLSSYLARVGAPISGLRILEERES